MGQFEYLMVLVSIILGLGIASLLTGASRILRARPARTYWVHHLWLLSLLCWHVGVWSIRWNTRAQGSWSFWELLTFLVVPILLFVLADLLFPQSIDADTDLKAFYYSNAPSFFAVFAALNLAVAITRVGIFRVGWLSPDTAVATLGAGLGVLLMVTRREWIHRLVAVATLLAVLLRFSGLEIG